MVVAAVVLAIWEVVVKQATQVQVVMSVVTQEEVQTWDTNKHPKINLQVQDLASEIKIQGTIKEQDKEHLLVKEED